MLKRKEKEEDILRLKAILLALVVSLLALSPMVQLSASPEVVYGPRMDKLHIINYGDPDKEFLALEKGEIDITDWPLTSYWVKKWVKEGRVPSQITMDPYAEFGCFEFDIYMQRWPTGCDGVAGREGYNGTFTNTTTGYTWNHYHTRQCPETSVGEDAPSYTSPPEPYTTPLGNGSDYDPETDSWKVYFDEDCLWCASAWGLRLAIAYLTDKDHIIATILGGLGEKLITWAAMPAQLGYLDVQNLTDTSFVYHGPGGDVTIQSLIFDHDISRAEMTAKAAELLDAAGFRDWDGDGTRNDPRKVAGDDKKYGTADDDKESTSNMSPLIFWIRLDDPNRYAAGIKLSADLQANKVPIDQRVADKSSCFKNVMILYDYHLYTGGFSFGADPPDFQYYGMHSSQYWYPVGWSGQYQGFCHVLADKCVKDTKDAPDFNTIIWGFRNATYLENKYVASIPLWSSASGEAYRTGWDGVVNVAGYGVTWGTGGIYQWSLFNMNKTGTDIINLGYKSSPEDIHVISSEWVWDWVALDHTYETLITRNPYNLAKKTGVLATSWSTGTWGGDKIYVDYTLKPGVKWHDGTNLTAEDVQWGLEFIRDCGPGVAWNYAMMKDVVNVTVLTHGAGGKVRVYFKTGTYWAVHNSGFLEFPSRKIWMAASQAYGWGYDPTKPPGVGTGKRWPSDEQRMKVREYKIYKDDIYDNVTRGYKPYPADGVIDLRQDGTGPWMFKGLTGTMGSVEYLDFEAFRVSPTVHHHLTQDEVRLYLGQAFHEIGNVNYEGSVHETEYPSIDSIIDTVDMVLIEKAMWTSSGMTAGIDWGQWNKDADINNDNTVDGLDYAIAGRNFYKTAG